MRSGPTATRRVILATNIAETSLTVPGVSVVIDTGQVKVARYDAERGVDSLTLERVTQDSADQRAGRAARLGPGMVRRLWDAATGCGRTASRRSHASISPPRCSTCWRGAAIRATFEWFEAPPPERVERGAASCSSGSARSSAGRRPRVTPLGRQLQRIPLHPRLARILLDGRGAPQIAAACALLAEPLSLARSGSVSTTCDLLPAHRSLRPSAVRT